MLKPLAPKHCTYFAFTLLFFAFLFGPVILFPNTIGQIGFPRSYIVAIAFFLVLFSFRENKKELLNVLGSSGCLGVALYFLSDLPIRPHTFAQTQIPLLYWTLLSALCYLIFYKKLEIYSYSMAIVSFVTAGIAFFYTTKGDLIFTDDHPCFLYRLIQLKENFPNIPFYNPLWNSGVEAREFFASGILNVFSLFAPLLYIFEIDKIYNVLVFALLFVVPPVLSIICTRALQVRTQVFMFQIVLGLSSSLLWYRWGFSYGTLGFILSSSLLPLNVIIFEKLLAKDSSVGILTILFYPVSLTLMFLWSPSILVFVLLVALSFRSLPDVVRNKQIWTIFMLTFLLNAPWVSVFYRVSGVSDFLTKPTAPLSKQTTEFSLTSSPKSGMHDISKYKASPTKERGLSYWAKLKLNIQRTAVFTNPVVLFFGFLCVLFFNAPEVRVFRRATLALLAIGLIGPLLKPQLELDRMLVMLALILSWPSAILLSEYFTKINKRICLAGSLGLLSLSPFWIWQVVTNQTSERYGTAGPIVANLAEAIKNNSGEGRTLFTGFMLHELSGGHLAPLAAWTSKPLIASSYQHDRWKYVDVVPAEYRKRRQAGIVEYFDLMNVSLVVAYDRKWKKWLSARPELFEEIWAEGRFKLFKRKAFESNYFLKGQGEILNQNGNSISLTVDSPTAVIRFNFLPFLKASNCSIYSEKVGEHVSFIRLENCRQGERVVIEAMGVAERFLPF